MDYEILKTAIEAQMLMGHCVPSACMALDRTTILDWSWDVDQVRLQLYVPRNDLWGQRVLELEVQGLVSFTLYSAAGCEAHPGWEDEPRETWGTIDISARGVLRLAELYGRPYVKLEESPAVLAHWQRVQAEATTRLHAPLDEARWEQE
jgi:hypothetical protein